MEDLRHRINQERVRWIEMLKYINTKIHKELERLDEIEVALVKGNKEPEHEPGTVIFEKVKKGQGERGA